MVALSALGNIVNLSFAQSRLIREIAKEGILPFSRFWASSWPFKSPSAGLLLHFIPSFIIVVAIPFGSAYNFILNMENYPVSIISVLVTLGLFILRWQERKSPKTARHRPFKVWWPVAAFFLIVQVAQLVAPFLRPPGGVGDTPPLPYWLYCVVSILVMGAAAQYWFVWWKFLPKVCKYSLQPRRETLKDGTNVMVYHRVAHGT